ncbi:hypothetical protein BE20_00040 [Sorangium cellulosum]|uniref:Protein kinase domain-containing protein n=1 Tax=Sorangium cellulosum TaxID=56 RepID=A0A150RUI3_SORCE|nr:hypothetical protein BE18_35110 [Sorangium cellulosum]KYF99609.1 hypothetical protein BE20_00040 [Sorangium cellulosum]
MQSARPSGAFPPSGRFTFRRRLGAGAFGVVYEAFDHERAARVALKTLHHLDAAALYRFKREFRALADVVHPNLVTLHELVSEGDQWFFTMDLVEGNDFFTFLRGEQARDETQTRPARLEGSLPSFPTTLTESAALAATIKAQAVSDGGARSPAPRPVPGSPSAPALVNLPRLRSALRQLGEGVFALHAAGKLHRDLKPSNVLVTAEGRVVIVDFGLVVELSPRSAVQSGKHIAGTPAYMAPEQACGEIASPASDWYAVGVMLYEALTGGRPFEGTSLGILTRKQHEEPAPPSAVAMGIPEDLDTLCMQLLRRLPLERPSGAEVLRRLAPAGDAADEAAPPPPPDIVTTPFIGRETHLAGLRDAFARAAAGRATTVHVRGMSGMGKSTLVRRFIDELTSRDEAVVLEGRCYEREAVPYKALDSLIDSLSRHLSRLPRLQVAELLPRDVRAVAHLFPVLDRVQAIAAAPRREVPPPDAQELRQRGFAGLRELLSRMADRRPLVLHIDDLQWGDADSAALLVDLLREPDPPGLLLLISYRSEDAEKSELLRRLPAPSPCEGDQGSDEAVRDLAVGPLEPSVALALALHVLGSGVEAGVRAEAVVAEAAGSPFFVHELAHAGQERPGELAGEIRLSTVLANRLSRLSAEARCLLEVIAVAGRPLLRGVARQASALSPEQERTAMSVLRAERVLRARGAGEDEELETFHDRIRETILAQLGAKELVAQHLAIAVALEASGTAAPDALALHFRRAERPEKAVPYAILAGDRAAQELAFDGAATHFAYALEAGTVDADGERGLRVKLGDALRNAGRPAQAAREYTAAARGVPADRSLEIRRRATESLLLSGQLDDGKLALRGILASVGMTLFQRPWITVLSFLFHRLLIGLHGLRVRKRPAHEVPAASLIRMDICWSAVVGLGMTDNIWAADLHARYLLLALRAGDPSHLTRALTLEIPFSASYAIGGRRWAQRVHRIAVELADEAGDPYLIALTKFFMGFFEALTGHWSEALAQCRAAEQIWLEQCSGTAWEVGAARYIILYAQLYRGELHALSRLALPLCEDAQSRGDLNEATQLRVDFTYWVPLAGDRPDAARHDVRDAMSRWSQGGFTVIHVAEMLALVRIDLYSAQPLAARQRLRDGWPKVVRSFLHKVQLNRVLIHSLRASSALAAAALNGGSDERLFRALLREASRDVRRLAREDVLWAQALADSLRAPLAALRGDMAAALSFLERAATRFDACEMALYAAAARRRRGELIGGDEGRALVEAAELWMTGQGIKDPVRMTALFAPGFR